MGLFSTKKIITVSSTLYNMAGDIEDRPNFLKSNMFGHMIGKDGKGYLGEHLTENYLKGPGIKQRNYQNWAIRNNFSGLPNYSFNSLLELDTDTIKNEIPILSTPANLKIELQSAIVEDGQFIYFAEQHILENYPELYNTDWVSDYDHLNHEIVIQYEDNSVETIDAGNFDYLSKYIIAYYYNYLESSDEPYVDIDSDDNVETHPDETYYTDSTTITNHSDIYYDLETKTTIDKSYSDSTPSSSSTSSTFEDFYGASNTTEYEKNTYLGSVGDSIETENKKEILNIFTHWKTVVVTTTSIETNDMGGGVTETVVTTTDTDTPVEIYDWFRQEAIITEHKIFGGYKIFIYKLGSGNINLDMYNDSSNVITTPEFFPFIPVRLNNDSITESKYDDNGLYEESKKAFKKAFGNNKFLETVENVEDNESIDDVDYAYIVNGVPLNVIENSSKIYLYHFFKSLISQQSVPSTEISSLPARISTYQTAINEYKNWANDQDRNNSGTYFGYTRPSLPILNLPTQSVIKVYTDNSILDDYDMRLSWINISETTHTGLSKIDVEKNEVWLEKGPVNNYSYPKANNLFNDNDPWNTQQLSMEVIYLYYQTSDTEYRKLTIYGLQHSNFIYKGKSVEISGHDALDDEDESGFLVPLGTTALSEMSLKDKTQMATANTYIVFNSYQVTKQKWYQSSIFKIIVIIAIIVITVVTGGLGSGLAASVGLLGANAAVGAAIGLTGLSAAIAGAVLNSLAALILTKAITLGATELLGDEIGQIVGTIVSIVLINFAASNFSTLDLTSSLNVKNLLGLTNALSNGYQAKLTGEVQDLNSEFQSIKNEFEEQEDYINNMLLELGGINDLNFNPLSLTDVNTGNDPSEFSNYVLETLDEFIHRTSMVGSDITDVTFSLVYNYPELANTLPKN